MENIENLKQLQERKDKIRSLTQELMDKFEDKKVYSNVFDHDQKERALFVLTDPTDITFARRRLANIEKNIQAILSFTGNKVSKLPKPTLVDDVEFVRVFENKSVTSRNQTTSRLDLIKRLEDRIELLLRVPTSLANEAQLEQYQKELEWFQADEEETYRLRSPSKPDTISHLYLANGETIRERLKFGGLFICNKNGDIPKVNTPDQQQERKVREGLYDRLESIPYSGTLTANLYRESDVIREKERSGYDHGATIESKKKKQKSWK
ncbi:hypothetical protein [Vibrio europaeus]|uniref:hypothetical protein n=1 Tax=Vibrio europaeus TaxID=300876 RepID=UPI00233F6303|nr:hypothetical protein [Vibrio europaeus]MDC5753576.1 hypothetical protein [Vibrio europaeus]MDC5816511.1 hypothetical protein [Vibrio europaeus]